MTGLVQRVVVAPAVIVLTVVLLTTIPLWVLGAALLSPSSPAASARCGCCG